VNFVAAIVKLLFLFSHFLNRFEIVSFFRFGDFNTSIFDVSAQLDRYRN